MGEEKICFNKLFVTHASMKSGCCNDDDDDDTKVFKLVMASTVLFYD